MIGLARDVVDGRCGGRRQAELSNVLLSFLGTEICEKVETNYIILLSL